MTQTDNAPETAQEVIEFKKVERDCDLNALYRKRIDKAKLEKPDVP